MHRVEPCPPRVSPKMVNTTRARASDLTRTLHTYYTHIHTRYWHAVADLDATDLSPSDLSAEYVPERLARVRLDDCDCSVVSISGVQH